MKTFKRNLVTAALPYGNGPVHIGHMAGAYLPADIYVRYLRLKGEDVAFICGLDEHGVPITLKAKKEGISPQELVDKYYSITKENFEDFGIKFDVYHRTSSELHHDTASDFFLKLLEKGVFREEEREQYYDEEAEQYLADRYIVGTCPNCGYDGAYGDQCEKCGSSLSSEELINPKSALSGSKPVKRKTTHWYLPLDQYEDWLREWIVDEHKEDWKPNVYGQCKSWLDTGLNARAITRDLDWGVPVPIESAKGKVLYVWFDAPIGYISATRYWAQKRAEKDPGKYSPDDWKTYWQDPGTRMIHFIGKDNIVFHCIIFPVMLKVHGDFILPDNVPSNEFLNLEGEKLSTSRGWAVWLDEYKKELPGKEDVLRYVLCANAPETKDNEFTWNDYQNRNNNELVAILGNFVNRVVVLTHKYFNGKVPGKGKFTEAESVLEKAIAETPGKVGGSLDRFRQREALAEMMNLAREGNRYLTENEPWKLIKNDPGRTATVLYMGLQVIANLYTLCEPFLPFTAGKIRDILGTAPLHWDETGKTDILKEGTAIQKGKHLFEKIPEETIRYQKEKLVKRAAASEAPEKTESKKEVDFGDFSKLDIRVGKILEAERVPKANKLLKLTVDIGSEKRTVVAGIAQQFEPENLAGKEVSVLINLRPRKIKGITSRGMLLMVENDRGALTFLGPENSVKSGSVIR